MNKAFDAYQEFRNKIKENGIEGITVSSFSNSTKTPGDGVFYVNNKSTQETIAMVVSPRGYLKSSTFINKAIEEGKRTTFIGKDLEKLKVTVTSESLINAVSLYDWSKAPQREDVDARKDSIPQKVEEAEPEFQ